MIPGLSDKNALSQAPLSHTFSLHQKQITFESGKFALLSQGSCTIADDSGNVLLTTVGVKSEANLQATFFPLSVEFQEKYYASGKIGGNRFMKREGRPSESSILQSRLIDRPIRPMFPKGTLNEIQVISTILSSDGIREFGFYGITGASLSLLLAGVKEFEGPVAGVRIALSQSGDFIFDPNFQELNDAKLDLTLAGTPDAITMVESQAQEIDEETLLSAFEFGQECIQKICQAQIDFVQKYQQTYAIPEISLTLRKEFDEVSQKISDYITRDKVSPLFFTGKSEFHERLEHLEQDVIDYLELPDDSEVQAGYVFDEVYTAVKKHMRTEVLENKIRLDGRKRDEVRPLRSSTGVLPRTHGTGLFQRGITQVLSVTTLGGPGDMMIVDDMYEEEQKRYMHHYNFPPFSVGEVKALRGVSRREVGHGRLAEKALEPVLPPLDKFPYVIRVVSETLTCNGSSSMASVCGSSLSLMDAGVPITSPVAGIAMGMIYDDETGKYEILSDIQAQEDFLGDLDFKIARSLRGVTALQMDCKIAGLPLSVIREVFLQAKQSLQEIHTSMAQEISQPRPQLSPYAPSILSIQIPVERIREVIGKGGEMVQKICKDFSVEIDITDEGRVSITAKSQESGKKAYDFIASMMREAEVGDTYEGRVLKLLEGVGAIVEFGNAKSGLLHISKIVPTRGELLESHIKIGDTFQVRIISVDKEKGKVGLEKVISA